MRRCILFALSLIWNASMAATPVLVMHGGAGVIKKDLTPEKEKLVRADLEQALITGYAVLKSGGTSLDAVSKAIVVLEDSPRFNAGKGAVFTHDGSNELDAAIMDGATLRAGAVAGVHRVRNPILLARAVMEKSQHVMLVGDGAEQFAQQMGIALVDPSYFRTDERWQQLQEALKAESNKQASALGRAIHYGTVGAVALDAQGHLAAATSTGGMTNKQPGRVGDTPIIGAGCYASNDTCAISTTGTGEMFIRLVAAHDVAARMKYAGASLERASHSVIHEQLPLIGGSGGLVAVDAHGNVSMPFNTEGMYRGFIRTGQAPVVAIYR